MSYKDAVLADSPVAYWRLGEAAGTVAAAEIGPAGAYQNSPGLGVAGLLLGDQDTAIFLSRVGGDYVLVDSNAFKFASGDFSAEVWATLQSVTGFGGLLTTDSTGDVAWKIFRDAGNSFFKGRYSTTILNFPAVVLDAVHHYVITKNGTTLSIYLDGELVASGTCPAMYTGGSNQFVMGSYRVDGAALGNHMHHGKIDDIALYATALSAARILEHYNAGISQPAILDGQGNIRTEGLSGVTRTEA